MRTFSTLLALLLSLTTFAFADEQQYDATVYITSTVYRVNTVTLSTSPTASLANQTSTLTPTGSPSIVSVAALPSYYPSSNGTSSGAAYPSGSAASGSGPVSSETGAAPTGKPSAPAFPGAASSVQVNALVALLAVGVGALAL